MRTAELHVLSETNKHLAGVGTAQQAEEGNQGVLDSVHDGFFGMEGSVAQPVRACATYSAAR
jgi:hypothetical protein